ncbi:ABC transport system periplasmic protein [Actinobacillus equuli]|nr:ABC transport system periplasmic protein [Actinobacillus equuli]
MSAFGEKGRLGWVHSALGIPLAKADVHKKVQVTVNRFLMNSCKNKSGLAICT